MNKPLTIHFFVQSVHPQGTYFRFHNLALGLQSLGHKVTVFGSDNNPISSKRIEERDGVTYQIRPGYKGQQWFGQVSHPITALDHYFSKIPSCDVAHLFQPFLTGAAPWYRMKQKRKARLLVYDWDDLWIGGLINKAPGSLRQKWEQYWIQSIEQTFPAKADIVTTCSQFLKDRATTLGAKHVEILHNGLWPYDAIDKQEARKELGLQSNAVYAGFMGRTTGEIEWIYEALENCLNIRPNLRVALCGMPEEVLPRASALVNSRIDYLGYIPPILTRKFSAALDIGLLPLANNLFNQSRFPIKYAEYMAANTPVLVSDVGECSYLSSGMSWVYKAGKCKDKWVESFKSWANDPYSTVPVNKRYVLNSFSWQKLAEKLSEIYELKLYGTKTEIIPICHRIDLSENSYKI